ncbi:adenine deaminase [Candidatus Harpocratesius sp.]
MKNILLKNCKIIDVESMKILKGSILIEEDIIKSINPKKSDIPSIHLSVDLQGKYLVPGFIESHIHIESSMMPPLQFCSVAVQHGTTTILVDPHEIANISGKSALEIWIDQAQKVPLDMYIGIPSCVPATHMEHSGATISIEDIKELISNDLVYGLGEMMNFPGIINNIGDAREKVDVVFNSGKIVDGHCPGVLGDDLKIYTSNGYNDGKNRIMNDHESTSASEVIEKLSIGMNIALRYGSATKDLDKILPELIKQKINLDKCSLCSDDLSPSDLFHLGHIDRIIRRSAEIFKEIGTDTHESAMIKAIRLATYTSGNYIQKFLKLTNRPPIGQLKPGFSANIVVLDNLELLKIHSVYHHGKIVYQKSKPPTFNLDYDYGILLKSMKIKEKLTASDFTVKYTGKNKVAKVNVIGITPISLVTEKLIKNLPISSEGTSKIIKRDFNQDILKIAVIERHHYTGNKSIGFIHGLGFYKGAFASTVAHDSHNLIIVGASDQEMADLGNFLREKGGGMAILYQGKYTYLPLQIGGLMSTESLQEIVSKYENIKNTVKTMGVMEQNIFMTLSFMALPVIPSLKISDIGLIDVEKFCPIDLVIE